MCIYIHTALPHIHMDVQDIQASIRGIFIVGWIQFDKSMNIQNMFILNCEDMSLTCYDILVNKDQVIMTKNDSLMSCDRPEKLCCVIDSDSVITQCRSSPQCPLPVMTSRLVSWPIRYTPFKMFCCLDKEEYGEDQHQY